MLFKRYPGIIKPGLECIMLFSKISSCLGFVPCPFQKALMDYLHLLFILFLLVNEHPSFFSVRNNSSPWSWEFICLFHHKTLTMWSRLFDSAGWHTCFFKQLLSLFSWQQMPRLSSKVKLTPPGKLKESDAPSQIWHRSVGNPFPHVWQDMSSVPEHPAQELLQNAEDNKY